MEIIFAKEYLKELQLTGKTSDKRYRFQPDIIKRYRRTIDRLAGARRRDCPEIKKDCLLSGYLKSIALNLKKCMKLRKIMFPYAK